jgi:superfamily I DNA and/or RNA helicase
MRNNVFWLDHENFEDGSQADIQQKSHSNAWEVDMVGAFLRLIIRQGVYSSTDIAILTPYTGQLQKLRSKLRNEFEIVLSERDQEMLQKEGFVGGETEEPQSNNIFFTGKPLQKKQMSYLLR